MATTHTKPLQVSLHVESPSVIAVTVGDTVQLDRITATDDGIDARRHGALLSPGLTEVALEPGDYAFRTLCDADLQVVQGGVGAVTVMEDKGDWPDPKVMAGILRGDAATGAGPRLTVRVA